MQTAGEEALFGGKLGVEVREAWRGEEQKVGKFADGGRKRRGGLRMPEHAF